MRASYEDWTPGPDAIRVIAQATEICRTYAQQGYDLTLRQLYYQFVARALIPNNDRSYKRLGSILNKARMAGLLDWDYIVDRTRNLRSVGHWGTPGDILGSAAASFRLDKWSNQPVRIEVWVEKEALAGVVQRVADQHDVAWFSCRGYVSQSELWGAGQRLLRYIVGGQRVVVLHLGDHDPSGIDMTRDITDRLDTFTQGDFHRRSVDALGETTSVGKILDAMRYAAGDETKPALEVRRIALTMEQIEQYDPPPNPAKITDSRARGYMDIYGDESWELDALDPATLAALITEHVEAERDDDLWDDLLSTEGEHRDLLDTLSERWADVREWLADQED